MMEAQCPACGHSCPELRGGRARLPEEQRRMREIWCQPCRSESFLRQWEAARDIMIACAVLRYVMERPTQGRRRRRGGNGNGGRVFPTRKGGDSGPACSGKEGDSGDHV